MIKVLNHGFIRLVDHMGSDLSVVRSARVSYDAEARVGIDKGSDHRLINYLWTNKHTSPFESVTFTFEVKAPIFVLRQWMRHRTWSYNEISGRYSELTGEFYVPRLDVVGKQHSTNKQMRSTEWNDNAAAIRNQMQSQYDDCFETYKTLIEQNCPRELARCVLPVSTYSHMFCTVNLLNLLKFLTLRDHGHAQYEMQVYAKTMKELIKPIVPMCIEAWESK